jgi:hypothetical protein
MKIFCFICIIFVVALLMVGWHFVNLIFTRRAKHELLNLLFPLGDSQKEDTLEIIGAITRNRFSDEELLDYYLKIKGLQAINLNDPVSYWIRRYLLQPTRILLNYFEQVKFYESFLNYPEIHGKLQKSVIAETPRKQVYARFDMAKSTMSV